MESGTLFALTVTVALLGAGCLGAAGDEARPASQDEAAPEADSNSNASEDGLSSNASPDRTETRSVSHEGQLGLEATACTVAACAGSYTCVQPPACQYVGDPRTDRSFEVPVREPATAVHANLTWDAVSPVTEELRFGIAYHCEEECEYEHVAGTSPLELSVDGFEAEDLHLWVWRPNMVEGAPAYVGVTHDQPFQIEGEVTVQAG